MASVTSEGLHTSIALKKKDFNIVKLLAPERSFDIRRKDGTYISHAVDLETQIPIVSLLWLKARSQRNGSADVDLVLIDLADIVAKFCPYLWTMTYVLESCEKFGKRELLLERQNSISQQYFNRCNFIAPQ